MWNDKALYLEINHVPRCITLQGVEESDDLRVRATRNVVYGNQNIAYTQAAFVCHAFLCQAGDDTAQCASHRARDPKGAPFDHAQTFAIVC